MVSLRRTSLRTVRVVLAMVAVIGRVTADGGPYGLATSPPLGWRSWNCYTQHINQTLMEATMDKLAERRWEVNGKIQSLADVGYIHVGLDDAWQLSGGGVDGTFFRNDGTPIIDTTKFPDMKAMNDKAHSLGLKSGWYMNNCIDTVRGITNTTLINLIYENSVKTLVDLEYDGLKLDGCSQFHDTVRWSALLNATGRHVLIENAHNTQQPQSADEWNGTCPFNFYRTSSDISPHWSKIFFNIQSVTQYENAKQPLTRPHCWAYADMLEVGNLATYAENRAHFGLWCINSQPLILGLDLTDDARLKGIWDIVTNTEAIAINQAYVGVAGHLHLTINNTVHANTTIGDVVGAVVCDTNDPSQQGWRYEVSSGHLIGPNGHCVSAVNASQLRLVICSASDTNQQFDFNVSAAPAGFNLRGTTQCIAEQYPDGPIANMQPCSRDGNVVFTVSGNGMVADTTGLCLAARASVPVLEPPILAQVWTKPMVQDRSRIAVLAVTNIDDNQTHTFDLDFGDLGLPADRSVAVRDIWARQDIGTFSGHFTTDALGGHDSRFYVFDARG